MLKGVPDVGRKEDTHLLRRQQSEQSGAEITYKDAKHELDRAITRAKIDKSGRSPHFLRIGDTTASNIYPDGGELVVDYMDMWRSNAGDEYLHEGSKRLDRAGISIGKEMGDN